MDDGEDRRPNEFNAGLTIAASVALRTSASDVNGHDSVPIK